MRTSLIVAAVGAGVVLSEPLVARAARVWEEAPESARPVGVPPRSTPPSRPVASSSSPPPEASSPPPSNSSEAPSAAPPSSEVAVRDTPRVAPTLAGAVHDFVAGPNATPDLFEPAAEPPRLAAGGPAGSSRYAEGVSQRWLDVGFYTQPQVFAQTGYDPNRSSNFSLPPGFSLARTRIILHGQLHPLAQVRFEFNISDRMDVLDAYVLSPIHRAFNVQVGQFRVPFSRQELVSAARYQFAANSLWSGAANLSDVRFIPSFDLGAMVWGWFGPRDLMEYYAGIFNGEGRNQLTNQDFNFLYAGRIVVNPIGRPASFQESYVGMHRPSIQIAIDGAYQDRQIGFVDLGSGPRPNVLHVLTLGADIAAFAFGASVYAELYYRDLRETNTAAAPSTESLGWLVQAGYFIPAPYLEHHLEIVGRIQDFDPSDCFTRAVNKDCGIRPISAPTQEVYRDFQHTTAITFGINWYQIGHGLKAQLSYTINRENRGINGGPDATGIVDNDVFLAQLTGAF